MVLKEDRVKEVNSIFVRNMYEALRYRTEVYLVKKDYESLNIAIEELNLEILPKIDRMSNRPQITDSILMLMDARRN